MLKTVNIKVMDSAGGFLALVTIAPNLYYLDADGERVSIAAAVATTLLLAKQINLICAMHSYGGVLND